MAATTNETPLTMTAINGKQAEPTDFATTHCMKCAAGWTREGENGATIVVCLLDREPVLTNMTDCDRFEPKEELQHLFDQLARRTTRK